MPLRGHPGNIMEQTLGYNSPAQDFFKQHFFSFLFCFSQTLLSVLTHIHLAYVGTIDVEFPLNSSFQFRCARLFPSAPK